MVRRVFSLKVTDVVRSLSVGHFVRALAYSPLHHPASTEPLLPRLKSPYHRVEKCLMEG